MAADLSTVEVCSMFEGNFAEGHGGGLASIGNSYVLLCNGAVLHKNIARLHGGGLYVGGLGGTFGNVCSPQYFDCRDFICLFSIDVGFVVLQKVTSK